MSCESSSRVPCIVYPNKYTDTRLLETMVEEMDCLAIQLLGPQRMSILLDGHFITKNQRYVLQTSLESLRVEMLESYSVSILAKAKFCGLDKFLRRRLEVEYRDCIRFVITMKETVDMSSFLLRMIRSVGCRGYVRISSSKNTVPLTLRVSCIFFSSILNMSF